MPLYEYQCDKCSKVFEIVQKFSDAPASTCEGCGGELKRLISRTSFQLKGGGWYATDYKGSGSKGAAAPASSTKANASGSGGSDSKS